MRITILGHCYATPENRIKWKRFAEIFADCWVSLLVPNRFHTNRYGPEIEYVSKPEEKRNYQLFALRQTPRFHGLYWETGYILRGTLPDIFIIVEEYNYWVTLQALLWHKIWSPKTQVLAATTQNIPPKMTRWYHLWRDSYVLRNVDAINAISEESTRLLQDRGFTKPILVQEHTGVDERAWHPDPAARATERRKCSLEGFVIGYVGALREEKGLLDLIRAAAHLRGDWQLLLVGDGPLRPHIEALSKELDIYQRLHLPGYVARGETPAFYRCMDVLVLPSHTTPAWKEQFGVVLAEAMLCGVCVVGSDSGAIPEVIGDAGLVFPEGDSKALAMSLQHLHDNPSLRAHLVEKGYQRSLAKYSLTAMAQENYAFFKQLLAKHRQ